MFKQIIFPLLAAAVFIVIVGIFTQSRGRGLSIPFLNSASKQSDLTEKPKVKVGEVEVFVDIADTNSERQKGLSGQTLEESEGMLFIFDQKDTLPSFWMKDMEIAIDIIWIDDEKVQKIDKNVQPEPGTPDQDLKKYYPAGPVDQVLEVSAGFSEKNNIEVGNNVVLPN